jgi:hypothetical protein
MKENFEMADVKILEFSKPDRIKANQTSPNQKSEIYNY